MKKSLEDIRRRYGEKSDGSGRGSSSSRSSDGVTSDEAIKDEPPPKLKVAAKTGAVSCPEFVKPSQQLPSTADLSKIDFSSSVVAGDLGQMYANETVFNVFPESQCNSSIKSSDAQLELPVDESIILQPNLDSSKTDFSSTCAANNFNVLYTNESLDKLFPGSSNSRSNQGDPTTSCHISKEQKKSTTSVVLCPPEQATEQRPMNSSKNDSSSTDCTKSSENHKVVHFHPPLSDGGIPSQSVRNSNSQVAGTQRISDENFQKLVFDQLDQFTKLKLEDVGARIQTNTMEKSANDMKISNDGKQPAIAGALPYGQATPKVLLGNGEINMNEVNNNDHSSALEPQPKHTQRSLPVIYEESRKSDSSEDLIVDPPIDHLAVCSGIPAGNGSNVTNPEQNPDPLKETTSEGTKHETLSQSILPTNSASSDLLESTESKQNDCREKVSERSAPLPAGHKAPPVHESPVESRNIPAAPEIIDLPKPRDYLEHDWYIHESIPRLLLGTSGCYYEGGIENNRMLHGHGRFFFGNGEYIEATRVMNDAMNGMLWPYACYLTVADSMYTIFRTASCYLVSIRDKSGYDVVAKAAVICFEEIEFNKSVEDMKVSFLSRFEIKEIIHDEWRAKRNTSLEEFKVALEALKSEESDVVKNAKTLFLLREILIRNMFDSTVLQSICIAGLSTTLRAAAGELYRFEEHFSNKMRDIQKLRCSAELLPTRLRLREIVSGVYKHRITQHRRSLLLRCRKLTWLKEVIESLPEDRTMYITRHDVDVFHHLVSLPCAQQVETREYTKELFTRFVEGFERKLLKIDTDICPSKFIPLIPPVFEYLFKSLSEIAGEIVSNADGLRFQDMLLIDCDGTWNWKREIEWAIDRTSTQSIIYCQSLELKYSAVADILESFSPGNYDKDRTVTLNLEGLSNERSVWVLFVVKCIPYHNSEVKEAARLYRPLLQCYVSFLRKSRVDDHDSFRTVALSIVRFILTSFSFTREYDRSAKYDTVILKELMSLVIPRISRELESTTSFLDLIEELSRYWDLVIDFKTRRIPSAWGLMEMIVRYVVRPTVRLDVPVVNLVRYLRSLNDFINGFKDIDFESCWYVKRDAYHPPVMEKVNNELSSSEYCSYRVTDADGLVMLLKGKEMPKHYIFEIVRDMITCMMSHISSHWRTQEAVITELAPTEEKAKAIQKAESTGMLLDAMRQSFLYLKEQPERIDFEAFKTESLLPFKYMARKCNDFNEFKNRINMLINESFWQNRSANEMGIDEAIALFANVNERPISEQCSDAYNLYSIQYNSFIETYCCRFRDKLSHAKSLEIVKRAMKMPGNVHFSDWTEEFKTKEIPKILAGLSAVWSILMCLNAGKFLEPHCIQILCLLRLLSIDKPKGAENHLAQVSTGQGKSLILALLSAVLALTGHKVRIVCYSEYLSRRGENDFKEFFQHFGIADAVSYGTFEDMANGFLYPVCNGERTSLRKMVRGKVLRHEDWASLGSVKTESSDTVLLMDEVDIFFNSRFYGNCYDSLTAVQIPGLASVQLEMWRIAKSSTEGAFQLKQLTDIHISREIESGNQIYIEFDAFRRKPGTFHLLVDDASGKFQIKEYTNLSLVDEHLLLMSKDAITLGRSNSVDHLFKVNNEGYVCRRNSAGQYLQTTVQSYENTFAYFKLKGSGPFSETPLPNFGYLALKTGRISYARLPCQFPLIMGVSGTLKDLNEYEKKGIDSYIKEISVVPSIFGEPRLKFNAESDFMFVYKQQDWLNHVFHKVTETVDSARAVVVFFESDEELNLFAGTFMHHLEVGRVFVMNSDTNSYKRDWFISQAGVSRTVTLTTRAMGRGADYKSSAAVEKLGGIHVVQTFFSGHVKEEIQIRGRTARKDNKGSYELVVCKEHLVRRGFIRDCESEHTYSTLQRIRMKAMDDHGKHLADLVSKSEHDHEMTMMYYGMAQFDKTISDASIALGDYWKSPGAQ